MATESDGGDVAIATSPGALPTPAASGRPGFLQRAGAQGFLRNLTAVAALCSFAIIFVMLGFLFIYAWPAIVYNGTNFFTGVEWNIGNQYGAVTSNNLTMKAQPGASFGALVFIFGTLATAGLTMIFSVPLSILVALALVYRVLPRIRPMANALVELMAGIPSVVYGLWGLVVLVPWIGNSFGPFVEQFFGWVPGLQGGAGSGNGLMAATFILVLMVTPIMVATIRDVVLAQASSIFEASMALGATSWQSVTRAVLPSVRGGIIASVLIAFGRALGETMAVLMVCGAAINAFPKNVFQPVNTIAAVIVSQLESALTDSTGMAQHSLAELAVTLFAITLSINIFARTILRGADRGGK